MKRQAVLPILLAAALGLGGCAFVPKTYPRLEAARDSYLEARADPGVARDAADELRDAGQVLARASVARNTLDDPARVDHLAYMTKQRLAIAREVAIQKTLQRVSAAR